MRRIIRNQGLIQRSSPDVKISPSCSQACEFIVHHPVPGLQLAELDPYVQILTYKLQQSITAHHQCQHRATMLPCGPLQSYLQSNQEILRSHSRRKRKCNGIPWAHMSGKPGFREPKPVRDSEHLPRRRLRPMMSTSSSSPATRGFRPGRSRAS